MKKILHVLSFIVLLGLFSLTSCEEPLPQVTSITIHKSAVLLEVGQSTSVPFTIKPDTYVGTLSVGYEPSYSPANGVASITPSLETKTCEIEALKPGRFSFYLSASDVHSSLCQVIVKQKENEEEEAPHEGLYFERMTQELTVGEDFTFVIKGAPQIEWMASPSRLVDLKVYGNKALVTALYPGEVTISALANGVLTSCIVTISPLPVPAGIPNIPNPSLNEVTIAIRVPAPLCNGVGFVGCGAAELDYEWSPSDGADFTLVDGTTNWWAVTLSPAAGKTLADIQGKVVAYPETGKEYASWSYQWGYNDDLDHPNVKFVEGISTSAELGNISGVDPQIVNVGEGGNVVYIDILAWNEDPCLPKNPAGFATFTLFATNLPVDARFITICGNFGADSEYLAWAPGSGPEFIQSAENPSIWTASCRVPADFQYKYVWSADGTTWGWDYMMKGNNIHMSLDMSAEDVIDAWSDPNSQPPSPDIW